MKDRIVLYKRGQFELVRIGAHNLNDTEGAELFLIKFLLRIGGLDILGV